MQEILGLRAKKIKKKDIIDGKYKLISNKPVIITKENNDHVVFIHEKKEEEFLYIHSRFDGDTGAMVGQEFCVNFLNDPKKVDMT